MNTLQIIEGACARAIEEAEEGTPGWEKVFVSEATPLDVRELCALARQFMQYAADKGDQRLVDELRMRIE